jgi:hypothetical protein
MQTMYHSVAESIDDMFFGPSMLDVMIQRLTAQTAEFVGIVGSAIHDEDLVAQALRASAKPSNEDSLLQLSGDLKPLEGETSTSSFSSPICDLILAVFELDKQNNWLRRQAIVIILQQVLGSTIERYVLVFFLGMMLRRPCDTDSYGTQEVTRDGKGHVRRTPSDVLYHHIQRCIVARRTAEDGWPATNC